MTDIVLESVSFTPGADEQPNNRTMTITFKGTKDGRAFEDVWSGLPYAKLKEAIGHLTQEVTVEELEGVPIHGTTREFTFNDGEGADG